MAISDAIPVPGPFGRYQILKLLGKGGMGAVYLARDTRIDREVALKIPQLDGDDGSADVIERFQREARAAGNLHHPNICPVFDVDAVEGRPYLTMRYIEGRPLTKFISRDKPQNPRNVAVVVRKLASALEEAHRHGIVHRDLKPANVMMDARSEPIVMDFGLARQIDAKKDLQLTQSGMIVGTPAYMSPEQIAGDPRQIGPHTDVWSLGVILFELLTGRLPYEGNALQVIGAIQHTDPPAPSQFRADVPAGLEAICRKMLSRNVAERYASMTDVIHDLNAFLKDPTKGARSEETLATIAAPFAVDPPARDETPAEGEPLILVSPAPTAARGRGHRAASKSKQQPAWVLPVGSAVLALVVLGILTRLAARGTTKPDTRTPGDSVAGAAEKSTPGSASPVQAVRAESNDAPAEKAAPALEAPEAAVPKPLDDALPNAPQDDAKAPPEAAVVQRKMPDGPPGGALRWYGYSIHDPKVVPEIAGDVNVIHDRGWQQHGDATIGAARDKGLPVVLGLYRADFPAAEPKLFDLIRPNRDVVAGVNFLSPYDAKQGFNAEQLDEFGKRLKKEFPGITYCVSYIEMPAGMREPLPPVPPQVDVVEMTIYFDMNPAAVRKKVGEFLPGWQGRAGNRPLVLRWVSRPAPNWDPKNGLKTAPGTLQQCAALAIESKLAGLVFEEYGARPDGWAPGIETDATALAEARAIARNYGFARERPAAPAGPAPKTTGKWKSLFDGKTLAGWRADAPNTWAVQRGVLKSAPGTMGYLATEQQFADFELELEFRLPEGGNSGVFLRIPDDGPVTGAQFLEVQLADDARYTPAVPEQLTGSIYRSVTRTAAPDAPAGKWNAMQIVAQGTRITVTVNQRKILDADLKEHPQAIAAKPNLARPKGRIGLQRHKLTSEFRNIRLRTLNE